VGGGTVAFAFEVVKRARALCPGSAGEVLQGVIGGQEVLVSLTVDRFSEMEVVLGETSSIPPGLWKSRRALELALEYFGGEHLRGRVTLRRRRGLPEGKGFASSTADIAATVGAVAHLLGRKIREEEIARLALSIEPTDGTFFPSWCLFDHLRGEVFLTLAVPQYLGVVVVELPGEVPHPFGGPGEAPPAFLNNFPGKPRRLSSSSSGVLRRGTLPLWGKRRR